MKTRKREIRIKARERSRAFRAKTKTIALDHAHLSVVDQLRTKLREGVELPRTKVVEHAIEKLASDYSITLVAKVADNAAEGASSPTLPEVTGNEHPIQSEVPTQVQVGITTESAIPSDLWIPVVPEFVAFTGGKLWTTTQGFEIFVQFDQVDERRLPLRFLLGYAYEHSAQHWSHRCKDRFEQALHCEALIRHLTAATEEERSSARAALLAISNKPAHAAGGTS